MAKEALYPINKNCIFRETFYDKTAVINNGGEIITGADISKGVYDATSTGRIESKLPNLKSGSPYSFRFRCRITDITPPSTRYFLDFRADGLGNSVSLVFVSSAISATGFSSVTRYVDGVATQSLAGKGGEMIDVVFTATPNFDLTKASIGKFYNTTVPGEIEMDLLEIYEGTLTVEEVSLLSKNKLYKGLPRQGLKMYQDYPFNQSSFDNSYNGNDGIDNNVVYKKQGAELKDANNSEIVIPHNSDLNVGTGDFTVCLLLNKTNFSEFADIFCKRGGVTASSPGFNMFVSGANEYGVEIADGSSEIFYDTNVSEANSDYHFVTFKLESGTGYLQVDDNTEDISIGSSFGRDPDSIYKAVLYYPSRALTDEERTQNIQYFKQRGYI